MDEEFPLSPDVMSSPRSLWRKAADAATAVCGHMTVRFSVGNNVLALNEAASLNDIGRFLKAVAELDPAALTHVGAAATMISLLTTVLVTSIAAREGWSGKERGVPYGVQATSNILTGVFLAGAGIRDAFAVNNFSITNPRLVQAMITGVCLVVWGGAHIDRWLLARRRAAGEHNPQPAHWYGDPQYLTGIADVIASAKSSPSGSSIGDVQRLLASPQPADAAAALAAVLVDTALMTPFILGLVKAKQESQLHIAPAAEVTDWRSFVAKHDTSNRRYALGYGLAAGIAGAVTHPYVAVALGLWASGYLSPDKKLNAEARRDIRSVFKSRRGKASAAGNGS